MNDIPWARSTDPETSKKVGKSKITQYRWGSQRQILLSAYVNVENGLTANEAGDITGLSSIRGNNYWKRCSELLQMGHIQDKGITRKSQSGEDQRVCTITEDGLEYLSLIKK
jgi:hypothetical protein